MGRQQQVFLIARVRSRDGKLAYQCVAALHHRWCYGAIPLGSMAHFFAMLSREENAAIVREELLLLDGKLPHSTEVISNGGIYMPCPYSWSLLANAWTRNLEEDAIYYSSYALFTNMLGANIGCWDAENGEGLSIIDITDPKRPRYCFMQAEGVKPLSAYQYLASYYDVVNGLSPEEAARWLEDPDGMASDVHPAPFRCFQIISALSGYALITADMLREAWPDVHFEEGDTTQATMPLWTSMFAGSTGSLPHWSRGYGIALARAVCFDRTGELISSESDSQFCVELFDQSASMSDVYDNIFAHPSPSLPPDALWYPELYNAHLQAFAARMLQHEQLFNFVVEPMVSIPIFTPSADGEESSSVSNDEPDTALWVLGYLVACDEAKDNIRKNLPLSDADRQLLAQVAAVEAKATGFVDLSGFPLTVPEIVELLSPLAKAAALSLARNPCISTVDIPGLLNVIPHVSRLSLMGCQGIEGDKLVTLIKDQPLSFRTLEGLIHPALARFHESAGYPIAFTFICAMYPGELVGVTLPMFTPSQVLQGLSEILEKARLCLSDSPTMSDVTLLGLVGYKLTEHERRGSVFHIHPSTIAQTSLTLAADKPSNGDKRVIATAPRVLAWPLVSDTPEGSWAFSLDLDMEVPSRRKWGFIHYNTPLPSKRDLIGVRAPGKVYDLRGFLRCMEEEGRPLPSPSLVDKLESILYGHSTEGGLFCSLLTQGEALPAFTHLCPPPRNITNLDQWRDNLRKKLKLFRMRGSLYSQDPEPHPASGYTPLQSFLQWLIDEDIPPTEDIWDEVMSLAREGVEWKRSFQHFLDELPQNLERLKARYAQEQA
ncbi:hypothetical protein GY45DRAFT_1298126 [Cubamyces sp. BRFM 1775]|nr:hypothetical protein GY45DRAFT_1298126 [Cubamyces sp. BRFM 1775]